MRSNARIITVAIAIIAVALAVGAQTKRRKPAAQKPTAIATPAPTPASTPAPVPTPQPLKRNERPGASAQIVPPLSPSVPGLNTVKYVYEFSRPGFTIGSIRIEHDESGAGKITFLNKDYDEPVTDPISLSKNTIKKLDETFAALDYLNSAENYQYEKDYSHLGNVKVTLQRGGRERTVVFNWTENKLARALADEYRYLSNQFIWVFNINLARENQPLEAPKLFDTLDGYLRRKEISDPSQIVPFLTDLSNDERLPLIARNHAARLIKQIEKANKQKK